MSNNTKLAAAGAGIAVLGTLVYFVTKPKEAEGTLKIPQDLEDRVEELMANEGLTVEEALARALYESAQYDLDNSQNYEDQNSTVIDDLFNDAQQSQENSNNAIEDAINDPTDAEKQAEAQRAAAEAAAKLQAAADAQKLIVEEKAATLSAMLPRIQTAQINCDTASQKVVDKMNYINKIETTRMWAGWLCQDSNFGGSRFGMYNGDKIRKLGDVWRDNSASSIQVKGYYKVTLYQDNDYGGSAFPIYSDDGSDIRIASLGSVWRNDSASSLKVEPHTNYLRNELTQLKVEAVSIASLARDLQNAVNIQIEATQRAVADLRLLNLYQTLANNTTSLINTVALKLGVLVGTINSINAQFGA